MPCSVGRTLLRLVWENTPVPAKLCHCIRLGTQRQLQVVAGRGASAALGESRPRDVSLTMGALSARARRLARARRSWLRRQSSAGAGVPCGDQNHCSQDYGCGKQHAHGENLPGQ